MKPQKFKDPVTVSQVKRKTLYNLHPPGRRAPCDPFQHQV